MSRNKTFSIVSLGCPRNTVDSEILKGALVNSDFIYRDSPEDAEVVFINTCGFIDKAREESIDTILDILELKRRGVVREVIAIGCMTELYGEELKKSIPEIDRIYGVNSQKDIVYDILASERLPWRASCRLNDGRKICEARIDESVRSILTPPHYAYLKIAEGCDGRCSFCIIPAIRGKQKSRLPESILNEAKFLSESGVKELILIAQDLTRYGTDLPGRIGIIDLLEKILSLKLFRRVRIMYCNPDFWDDGILALFRCYPELCRYIDMPIQHSSDRILRRMYRDRDSKGIRRIIESIRENIPDIAIRSSVMVGFPGESEEDFENLVDFISSVKFERLGVFEYSKEEGTPASRMGRDVPTEVKERRKEIIMQIQWDIANQFAVSKIGQKLEVVIDRSSGDFYYGRTEWDAPEIDCNVIIKSDKPIEVGNYYSVEIVDVDGIDLIGEVV